MIFPLIYCCSGQRTAESKRTLRTSCLFQSPAVPMLSNFLCHRRSMCGKWEPIWLQISFGQFPINVDTRSNFAYSNWEYLYTDKYSFYFSFYLCFIFGMQSAVFPSFFPSTREKLKGKFFSLKFKKLGKVLGTKS